MLTVREWNCLLRVVPRCILSSSLEETRIFIDNMGVFLVLCGVEGAGDHSEHKGAGPEMAYIVENLELELYFTHYWCLGTHHITYVNRVGGQGKGPARDRQHNTHPKGTFLG